MKRADETEELVTLKITPSGGPDPLPIRWTRLRLLRQARHYRIDVVEQYRRGRRTWRIAVPADEVEPRLAALRGATVPAYPESPLVTDGTHYALTVRGAHADLTLAWWTIGPHGADATWMLADWMERTVFPDDDDDPADDEDPANEG